MLLRVRGVEIGADDPAKVRAGMTDTKLSVNDQVADAVVAIYCERVVPGVTLSRMAIIADLDDECVKRAYIRRMDLHERSAETRRCERCGKKRRRDEFPRKRSSVDGLDKWCFTCCEELAAQRSRSRERARASGRQDGRLGRYGYV